jgi:hypothetical protein
LGFAIFAALREAELRVNSFQRAKTASTRALNCAAVCWFNHLPGGLHDQMPVRAVVLYL